MSNWEFDYKAHNRQLARLKKARRWSTLCYGIALYTVKTGERPIIEAPKTRASIITSHLSKSEKEKLISLLLNETTIDKK